MLNTQNLTRRPDYRFVSTIPRAVNLSLAGSHIFVNIVQLFILPRYLLPRSMEWGLILIPIAALNIPLWALIHEAIHDLFSASRRINLGAGRLLSVVFGTPFHVLRLTHLSHHKFNRSPLEKGTEMYDPNKISKVKAGAIYFFYIFCGVYLLEVSSALLFYLPSKNFHKIRVRLAEHGNAQERWLAKKFTDAKLIREIRIDGVGVLLIFSLSAFFYAGHWRLLVSLLTARMFLISFMDNVYHYGTKLNVTVSGHNLWLPRVLSMFILNFNFHRIHHRNPSIHWVKLPELFAQRSDRFDSNLFTAALHQLHGPMSLRELARPPFQREAPGRRDPRV